MNRYQLSLLVLLGVAAIVSCIVPPFPDQVYLQQSATVIGMIALAVLPRYYPISNAAFTCLIAFLLLHVVGARYCYSNVPYDDWTKALFGFRISDRFHFSRNHYDRVVHFCFGMLWVYPVWEVSTKYLGIPRRMAYFYAVEFVLAFSTLYELFEWGLTMTLSPDEVETYNGQQGDMWDAQKDVSLAFLGSLLGLATLLVIQRWRRTSSDS